MLKKYDCEFISINSDEKKWVKFNTLSKEKEVLTTNFSEKMYNAGILVSLCVSKTHANLGFTCAMKNLVGAIKDSER